MLSNDAKKLFTITTPFGKYEYNRLPMGVNVAPDIFQERICQLFDEIESVRAFIDDLLVVTHGNFQDHIDQLNLVMTKLEEAGPKCKIDKCFFAQPEMEYLGYIITTEGVKPNPKKVQAILDMQRPTNKLEVHHFVGMVHYYRNLWPRCSHILLPLTELTKGSKKGPITWTDECEQAFTEMKRLIARDTLLTYLDFNKKFTIYTDASDFQLGAVIMQEGRPLAFYSCKLAAVQKNYSTSEKEMLSIVETLKEFWNILLGYEIEVFMDHANLAFETTESSSQCLQHWRCLVVQEFDIMLKHVAGSANVVADAISPLPKEEHATGNSVILNMAVCTFFGVNHLFVTDNADALATDEQDITFPLQPQLVEGEQKRKLGQSSSTETYDIRMKLDKPELQWTTKDMEGHRLIHFCNKIYVPKTLRSRTLTWFHHYLSHPGGNRLAQTLQQVCIWRGIVSQARKLCKHCKACQKYKKRGTKYGHLAPKEAETLVPWHTVCVDLIGTYARIKAKIRHPDGTIKECDLSLLCMTFIDPATGWFKIAEVPLSDQFSARISKLFDEVWLSRYPRCRKVIFDNGLEFKRDFQPLLEDFAIKSTCTSIKNPQPV